MSTYKATIHWKRNGQNFTDNRYSRAHTWKFDGGIEMPASSSPFVVPPPLSDPEAVDPEEAFVASISSCHMLWFLNVAAKRGFRIDHYRDEAEAVMEKNSSGKLSITRVNLHPDVTYSGNTQPTKEENGKMHHIAHKQCFIANSVLSEIEIMPEMKISTG